MGVLFFGAGPLCLGYVLGGVGVLIPAIVSDATL